MQIRKQKVEEVPGSGGDGPKAAEEENGSISY